MQIKNSKNAIWADENQRSIDCEIEHDIYGWIPFTASLDDVEQHGRELFTQLSVGEVLACKPLQQQSLPTNEQLASQSRSKRNSLLAESDWTQAADIPQAIKDLWTPYRQALRDVPEQTGFPTDIVWPVKP